MQKIVKNVNYLLLSFVSVYICFICQNCILPNMYNGKQFLKFFLLIITSFCVLIIYDFLFMLIDKTIREILFSKAVKNIQNKDIIKALKKIKLRFIISKISYFMRLNWIKHGNGDINKTYLFIRRVSNKNRIINFLKLFINPVTLFSLFIIMLSDRKICISYLNSAEFILNIKEFILNIKFEDVWNYIKQIPLVISILPIILVFYFSGHRFFTKSVILDYENSIRKNIIEKIFNLSILLEKSFYYISKNMETIVKEQDIIVEELLKRKISNFEQIKKSANSFIFEHRFDNLALMFVDIDNNDDIEDAVIELFNEKNIDYFRRFSLNRYEFFDFYVLLLNDYFLYEAENERRTPLYLLLNTLDGIKSLLSIEEAYKMESKDSFEKLMDSEKDILANKIYDALDLLFHFAIFVNKFNRYTRKSSAEILLRELTEKNK